MYKKLHELAIGDRFCFGCNTYTVYGRLVRKGSASVAAKNVMNGNIDFFSPDVWVLIPWAQ